MIKSTKRYPESQLKELQDLTGIPNQKGFSRTNLLYMKKWYEFYTTNEIKPEKVQQLVGQIPWGQ